MNKFPLDIPYLPLIEIKPAEMAALQALPEKNKDLLLPSFRLKPWVGSHDLSKSLKRLREANGARTSILEMSDAGYVENPRKVHGELDELRASGQGYVNWVNYLRVEATEFIPTAQLSEPNELGLQIRQLHALGRGVVFRVTRESFSFLHAIVNEARLVQDDGADFLFVLDLDTVSEKSVSSESAAIAELVSQIGSRLPSARVAISSSSFPTGFVGLPRQRIFERELFDRVQSASKKLLIYSDHVSARIEVQSGFSGAPAPRIDYAGANEWTFFREDSKDADRVAAYKRQALICLRSPVWDSNLMVWGKQMIERTAYGDEGAIDSPPKATAARINMHLHQQLFYNNRDALYDTDEEWSE